MGVEMTCNGYSGYSAEGYVMLGPGDLECPECRGFGTDPDQPWAGTCPECGGEGVVPCDGCDGCRRIEGPAP